MLAYLLVLGDAALQALQLGVADLTELELRHGDHALALRDQLTAVAHKMAVGAGERLQDLQGETRLGVNIFFFFLLNSMKLATIQK